MKEQLTTIPTVRIIWVGERKPHECGQIVGKPLRRNEANGIPARTADVLDSQRMNVARAQKLIMFGTLLAVRKIREMLRTPAACERLLNFLEYVGIGSHGAESPNAQLTDGGPPPVCALPGLSAGSALGGASDSLPQPSQDAPPVRICKTNQNNAKAMKRTPNAPLIDVHNGIYAVSLTSAYGIAQTWYHATRPSQ